MNMDIDRVLGEVSRRVERRDDGSRVIVVSRQYDTTVDDLWDAITNPERIPRWFLPVSGDLRLGGRYQLEGNASGEVLRCEPPRELGLSWEFQGQVSWVNVVLAEAAESGATLRLEHVAHVPDDMWDQFGPGAVGVGWDSMLLGLDRHFASGASIAPAEAMVWLVSAEGKRFVRQSSDGWREASVRAGTDATQARAAADRTTAAYTGDAGDGDTGSAGS